MRRLSKSERVAVSLRGLRGTQSSRRRRTSRRISSTRWRVDGVGSDRLHLGGVHRTIRRVVAGGGDPSGSSPLLCFWRVIGYVLCVMCYVLRITYARLPVVSISLFFTLRVASAAPFGVPFGVRRPSVDSGRRRGIVKQSGRQSVPQSVPQSVARTATAGKRSQSGGQSGGQSFYGGCRGASGRPDTA